MITGPGNVISLASAGQATYVANGVSYAGYATPTDMLTLRGSATKIIRVQTATMRINSTAAARQILYFIKRTAANTGGTASNPSMVPLDTNSPAASALVSLYSVIPASLGAGNTVAITIAASAVLTGTPGQFAMNVPLTSPTLASSHNGLVLRGTSEMLAFNWNGAAIPAGFDAEWEIMWTEADT